MPDSNSKKPEEVAPAAVYFDVFQRHPGGQKVLDDLSRKYYDRSSVTNPVDPNATLVMEGQRQVVLYILKQCQEGQE